MKIIDLLNKIANGEEVPKKIKYKDDIYIHVDNHCYVCEETYEILSNNIYAEHNSLNDEVEIIEEDKKIEKINNFISNVGRVDDYNIEEYIHKLFEQEFILFSKFNEIIDKLNKDKES